MSATATAKAKTKQAPTPKSGSAIFKRFAEKNGHSRYHDDLDIKLLSPSPTNPRRRMNEAALEELAANIAQVGIIEPLVLRTKGEPKEGLPLKFEIVCGERRWRAAKIAKQKGVPAVVRDLTDEQVLEIQIDENLHRDDLHPMDEAYGYQVLKEKLGCDAKEIALRVGKSEGYVLNRLKLNNLIEEAQKDIDDGHLPLSYALEIAKYPPDIQKYIYDEVYRKEGKYQRSEYVYTPVKGETVPLRSLIEWINTNIHRLLAKAPFDPKATDLREDGLACVNCPERTGAVVNLFEPNQIGKKDACLNPVCYVQKVQNHVQVRRQKLAEQGGMEVSQVPVVRSWSYPDGKDHLGTKSATVIGVKNRGSSKSCKHAVSGIDIEPDNYGKTVQVCLRLTKCKTHWPDPKVSSNGNSSNSKSAEVDAAERLETHRLRREEIWNAKIAEAVRVRVFKQSAEKFEKKFSINDAGTDFLPQMIARFWRMTASGDQSNLKHVVRHLLDEWDGKTDGRGGTYLQEGRAGIEYIKGLKRGLQFRVLFLLIHCHKGTIGNRNNYASQKDVKELAAEFEVDYALIDAEVRLEFSSKKHKQAHQIYLDAVRKKSKDAKVPWLLSEKWKAND